MKLVDQSIIEYLERKGFKVVRRGNKWFTNSPYSSDRTPSFCIFPDNRFKCFSTGKSGNIITLAKFFGEDIRDLKNIKPWVAPTIKPKKPFNNHIPNFYLKLDDSEQAKINAYAKSRKLTNHLCGKVQEFRDGYKQTFLSVIFPHQDLNGAITGAKFRFIKPIDDQRFTSRGILGFYILETAWGAGDFYLVEGEANCNSLWQYFNSLGKPATVACSGGVYNIPTGLPTKYSGANVKLIIDYDGDRDKFDYRCGLYKHFNPEIIKLELPKGEDLNSLWINNRLCV